MAVVNTCLSRRTQPRERKQCFKKQKNRIFIEITDQTKKKWQVNNTKKTPFSPIVRFACDLPYFRSSNTIAKKENGVGLGGVRRSQTRAYLIPRGHQIGWIAVHWLVQVLVCADSVE